jgi:Uncharacterized protein conserved in bacteria (DUF2188)
MPDRERKWSSGVQPDGVLGFCDLPLLSRRIYGVIRIKPPTTEGCPMSDVTYEIVEHDGGWAYKVDGVFSEPFPTHAEALAAARAAAQEQEIPGHMETIEYEDDKGKWHTETASGRDRPHTVVRDKV